MSPENPAAISPTTEMDTVEVSDQYLVRINCSFEVVYGERRQGPSKELPQGLPRFTHARLPAFPASREVP